jgi:hypothetical protein
MIMLDKILAVPADNGVMALATNRPDDWPRAKELSEEPFCRDRLARLSMGAAAWSE